MADNLENFFKKHLSDETSGEDNWNVPSDGVWENVIPEIQKESGLFVSWKNLMLIAAGLILAAMLVLFLLWNRNTNDNLSVKENENPVQISSNQNDQQIKATEKDNLANPLNETSSIEESKKSKSLINNTEELIKEETNTSILKNTKSNNIDKLAYAEVIEPSKKETTKQNNKSINSQGTIIEEETFTFSDNNMNLSAYTINKIESVGSDVSIDSLIASYTREISDEEMRRIISSTSSKLEDPIFYNDKGKIGIGAFFTPTITSTYLKGDMINGIENTSPMYLYSSNYGLELKYHFSNKLALVFGIGKSEIKSWSKSNVDFNYNTSSEEIMPGGDKSNTSDIPMPTPFGDVSTSITYHFPGSAILPDGEVMQSVMETHQRIQYLSIPLGIEYKLLGKNRIKWIVEGGFRFNKSVIDGSEFTSRILHEGQDMEVVEEQQTGDPDFKDIYFNYYIGTGLNYRLRKNLQFNTSLRYLGNIDDVNLQNNMSTNVHEFNLKVSILYLF